MAGAAADGHRSTHSPQPASPPTAPGQRLRAAFAERIGGRRAADGVPRQLRRSTSPDVGSAARGPSVAAPVVGAQSRPQSAPSIASAAGSVRAGVAAAVRAPGELLQLLSSVSKGRRRTHGHMPSAHSPPQPNYERPASSSPEHDDCVGESGEQLMLECISADHVDIGDTRDSGLRGLVWANGVPSTARATSWKLLTGYLSVSRLRRDDDLRRKRREYSECVQRAYHALDADSGGSWDSTMRLIRKDVPRTAPEIALFQTPTVQQCLERILFVWAFRHPACSYVQGMNDLTLPFLLVFLREACGHDCELLSDDVGGLEKLLEPLRTEQLAALEADVYWCFKRHLEPIQDHYTENQPGIQRRLQRLKELLSHCDRALHDHFESAGVQMIQFAYKWMNCLLVRELPIAATVRLWDTYLAEGEAFADMHVYVCLALLKQWSGTLQTMDFAAMLQFLQTPPTRSLRARDVSELLSSAYLLQQLWEGASPAA
eukprot:TRINITY_DN19051_c0_g1_i1.p1 TRINITY_DN19051_c0_g1~~TRINITY_DN19051_c0_g1_i1.p1  ORF type:complete len:553 (+),score=159.90 TRINITY_DN19051_c0_g1_i1:200-1660(+)